MNVQFVLNISSPVRSIFFSIFINMCQVSWCNFFNPDFKSDLTKCCLTPSNKVLFFHSISTEHNTPINRSIYQWTILVTYSTQVPWSSPQRALHLFPSALSRSNSISWCKEYRRSQTFSVTIKFLRLQSLFFPRVTPKAQKMMDAL